MRYFAQVTADRKWDEVSEEVYNNTTAMFNLDDTPRYNGNRFCFGEKEGIRFACPLPLNQTELAIITRLCGAERSCPASVPGGFVNRPDFLIRKKGKAKPVLLHLSTGQVFRKDISKIVPPAPPATVTTSPTGGLISGQGGN